MRRSGKRSLRPPGVMKAVRTWSMLAAVLAPFLAASLVPGFARAGEEERKERRRERQRAVARAEEMSRKSLSSGALKADERLPVRAERIEDRRIEDREYVPASGPELTVKEQKEERNARTYRW